MKKQFPTFIDQSAEGLSVIVLSGGRIGVHIELALPELRKALPITAAALTAGEA